MAQGGDRLEPDPGPDTTGTHRSGWIVGGVVVLVGIALILLGEEVAPPLTRGDAAPEFELPLLSGQGEVALSSLRGRVTLVNFWATWCKPCEDEMPAMDRLYAELHPQGFELVAIAVDESRNDIVLFQERMKVGFPILLDPTQAVSRTYQTTGFPESILVSSDGQIVERYVGPRDWDHPDYVARIRRLMQ
jgi:thiol-disulfide isomerase/thioredoxin